MNRTEHLNRLASQSFDLIIVGGGISGACLAYDAARRGVSVALLDKGDFGGATSAASSKLLHGGIRYLQQGRLDKVRESAFERVYFQNLVPHLCHYVPFLIPTYRELSKGRLALRAALLAYAAACAGQNRAARHGDWEVPAAHMISVEEMSRRVPFLRDFERITGGAVLPECHMESSERVTLALISGAVEHGAVVGNYTRVESMQNDGAGDRRIVVTDTLSDSGFAVGGKAVANCAGPWIGRTNELLLGKSRGPVTGYSRGAHIVVEGLDTSNALALPTAQQIEGLTDRGGRHMFMIPWRGRTLIGTSYAEHVDSLDSVSPQHADVEQLIAGINDAVGYDLVTTDAVIHSYAGLYPLTTEHVDASIYQGSGDYSIIDHAGTDATPGYYSVFGAKFTTARLLAEKACDQIVKWLPGTFDTCRTRSDPVPAAAFGSFEPFVAGLTEQFGATVRAGSIQNIARTYGREATAVLEPILTQPQLASPLSTERETLEAEVQYSARHEMVCHLDDFVFRRSGLGTLGSPGDAAIRRCADILGPELGWSTHRREHELEQTRSRFTSHPIGPQTEQDR